MSEPWMPWNTNNSSLTRSEVLGEDSIIAAGVLDEPAAADDDAGTEACLEVSLSVSVCPPIMELGRDL